MAATAGIAPQGKFKSTKADGTPLSGGKLYTYDAGTTTPRSTYTSSTKAVTNSNPVILDARGEADVWLDGTYKFVLKDADDVTLWTVDDITSASAFTTLTANSLSVDNIAIDGNTISATNTNGAVNITSNGTGAVAVTGQYLSVSYGTTGPGAIRLIEDTSSGSNYANLVALSSIGSNSNYIFGDGELDIEATSATSSSVKLHEDTSFGSSYVSIKAPSSITSSYTFTLPANGGSSGQVLTTNGTGVTSWSAIGGFSAMRVYTSSTSWSKPTGLTRVVVMVISGGGGGGGTTNSSSGEASAAGGGGGGGFAMSSIEAGSLSASETVTVGAGGTAGNTAGTGGGTGGSSSFGAHVVVLGGSGGGGAAASTTLTRRLGSGGGGGTPSAGTIQCRGGAGGHGIAYGDVPEGIGGQGGQAAGLGAGGIAGGISAAGAAGSAYGGGGSGASSSNAGGAASGGAGAAGLVLVFEYVG